MKEQMLKSLLYENILVINQNLLNHYLVFLLSFCYFASLVEELNVGIVCWLLLLLIS